MRYLGIWFVVCLVAIVVLVITTEGEPVCEGPLIYDWDDSNPPQCNSLIDGLGRWLPLVAVASAVVTWLVAAAEWLLAKQQVRGS